MLKKLMRKPNGEAPEGQESAKNAPLLERDPKIDELANAAREVLLAQGISPDDKKLAILLEELAKEADLITAMSHLSSFWVDARLDTDLLIDLLVRQEIVSSEPLPNPPVKKAPTVEESAERVRREVILAHYGTLVRPKWKEGLLTTVFLAERSLEENLRIAIRWKIVEEILDAQEAYLNSLPSKSKRQREKKRLEAEAIVEAEAKMSLHDRS